MKGGRGQSLFFEGMLAKSWGPIRIGLKKARTKDERACLGCISRTPSGRVMEMGSFPNKLILAKLYGYENFDRRFGEGVLSVSMKESLPCTIHIRDGITAVIERHHQAWILPVPLNVLVLLMIFDIWKVTGHHKSN